MSHKIITPMRHLIDVNFCFVNMDCLQDAVDRFTEQMDRYTKPF